MLLEGKIDDLQKKYKAFDVVAIAEMDPSPTKKYLEWMIKQLEKGHNESDLEATIKYFHQNTQRFEKRDINAYKDLKELEDLVKEIGLKPTKNASREAIKGNAKKLYEDEKILLVRPDDKDAVMLYGLGTKWCITMRDADYYEEYTDNNVIFYFLISKKFSTKDEPMAKVAFAVNRRQRPTKNQNFLRGNSQSIDNIECFDAEDTSIYIEDLNNKYGETNVLPDGVIIDSLLNIIESDAEKVPEPFRYRLEDGIVSDEELLDYWKTTFARSLNDKDDLQRRIFLKSHVQKKLDTLKHTTIAQQKKIAKIDVSVNDSLKNGHYFTTRGLTQPVYNEPAIIRLSDNKIFYWTSQKVFESPHDSEIISDIVKDDEDNVKDGYQLYIDDNGEQFIKLYGMAADIQKAGITERTDEETGEVFTTYPPIV